MTVFSRRPVMRRVSTLILGVVVFGAVPSRADEALLPDGHSRSGTLVLSPQGRLLFETAGRSLTPPEFQAVRFAAPAIVPRPEGNHQVLLTDGQRLTGALLGVDAQAVTLHTHWSGRVAVPRNAVAALSHVPGWATLVREDFESDLLRWRLTGSAGRTDRQAASGRGSLYVGAAGDSADLALPESLPEGRLDLCFHDPGQQSAPRLVLELSFDGKQGPVVARLLLTGGERYSVEAALAAEESAPRPRSSGWHRLSVRFAREYLLVGVDDMVIWSSGKHGPGGPLTKVRLLAAGATREGEPRAEVFVDDLTVTRAVPVLPHPDGDETQDEVWLESGDSWFAQVVRADQKTIELKARFGQRTLPWSRVRGAYFRRVAGPPRATEGEHVRVRLRSDDPARPDEVEGVVRALSGERLVLHHAALGQFAVDRGRLLELRWLFHGRRQELDNERHHLGPLGHHLATLRPPRAEGTTLAGVLRLDQPPPEARLVLEVAHLHDRRGKPTDRDREPAALVAVNGQVVADLDRHLAGPPEPFQRVRVPLPAASLRAGENVIEVRLAAGRGEHCLVRGLAVEVLK